jgi:hypothetical protein
MLFALSAAAAAGPGLQRFALGEHGSIALDLPPQWRVSTVPLASPPSFNLAIRPDSGDAFLLKVTSFWMDAAAGQGLPPERLEEGVRRAADDALPRAVEKSAPLVPIRGRQTSGYYFSVTDKQSSNTGGDYKYLTQGTAVSGPAAIAFTLLSRSADPALRERVLRIVADASWSDSQPERAAPSAVSLRVDDASDDYRLTVPVSRLTLSIPKRGLTKAASKDNASPRYFLFEDRAHGVVVSGWFEAAEGFPGLEKFWRDETSGWTRKRLPDPEDVTFTKVGDWDAIVYDQAIPRVTNSHVRAHWVAAGTWIDVHLSITGDRPRGETRAALLKMLDSFRVEQKD